MLSRDLDAPDSVLERQATHRHYRHAHDRTDHSPAKLALCPLDDLAPCLRVRVCTARGCDLSALLTAILRVVARAPEGRVGVGCMAVQLEHVPVQDAQPRPHAARALRLAVGAPDPDAHTHRHTETHRERQRDAREVSASVGL
eukprot:1641788-Rhodomonas_salina.4